MVSRGRFESACQALAPELEPKARAALRALCDDDGLFSHDIINVERRANEHNKQQMDKAARAHDDWARRKADKQKATNRARRAKRSQGGADRASKAKRAEDSEEAYKRWSAAAGSKKYYSQKYGREIPRRKPIRRAPKRKPWVGPLDGE